MVLRPMTLVAAAVLPLVVVIVQWVDMEVKLFPATIRTLITRAPARLTLRRVVTLCRAVLLSRFWDE